VTTLLYKKFNVVKSEEVKARWNLAESYEKGYHSERVVLPMMIKGRKR
jgi:hypothetical protein